jgi:hypothetical protein
MKNSVSWPKNYFYNFMHSLASVSVSRDGRFIKQPTASTVLYMHIVILNVQDKIYQVSLW